MTKQSITSKSESDTAKTAQDIAATLSPPCVVLLNGNLGMGKTLFARALIRALCKQPDLEVLSPTFTLLQTYDGYNETPIYHYDLYRLDDHQDIRELGWDDALYDAITIIEWSDRLGPYKPARYLDITITNGNTGENSREIRIEQIG
ncbi:MAG: tRNA (adenosine(37)-N6)-threonylcarbamoyltransferase complex ATPase subunit type 1 TsaE [Bdellovibrionales bacterium]